MQAVAHETAVTSPQESDGFLSRDQCRDVIRGGIGTLVWRLAANMQWATTATADATTAGTTAKPDTPGGGPAKLYLFSGHDPSIMPLVVRLLCRAVLVWSVLCCAVLCSDQLESEQSAASLAVSQSSSPISAQLQTRDPMYHGTFCTARTPVHAPIVMVIIHGDDEWVC